MRSRHIIVIAASVICSIIVAAPVFSQDAGTAAAPAQAVSAPAPVAEASSQEVAIYGEVQSVDGTASSLSVQYYDYDSDSEKTADIAVVATTKLENAAAIGEIKKGDWVDVTYVVADGKNAAKVVTVEKEEAPAPEDMPQQAATTEKVPAEQ